MKPVIVLGYDARKCTRVLTYEYIHTRHLIHRDMKPSAVLIAKVL